MKQFQIDQGQAGQRLDKYLQRIMPNAPMSFFYKMLRKKNIVLNGKKALGKEILNTGDEVKVFFSDETFTKMKGERDSFSVSEYEKASSSLKGIRILYEDESFLVLDKPAGILTQKASDSDVSLNEWLIGYLLSSGSVNAKELALFRPSVLNRLDRNTSGIVLAGKTLFGSQLFSEMIRERTIRKFYQTICVGRLESDGVLKGYLSKDESENKVTVSTDAGEGVLIETHYRPLQILRNELTVLEVELITGKTHQIRAHLSGIGHPLLGDPKYGNTDTCRRLSRKYKVQRQLLHAEHIVFPKDDRLPKDLSGAKISSPLPEDFRRVIAESLLF